MRAPTSGVVAQLTTPGAFAGWLFELTLATGAVLRFTTLDKGFTFASQTWTPLDFEMPALSWDGTILKPAKIVVGDADLMFWTFALELALADAGVRLWSIYAGAPTEGEPVWSGTVAGVARAGAVAGPPTCTLTLTNSSDTSSSPRTRIQAVVDPQYLLPPGAVLFINGQRWIVDRPVSGADAAFRQ